ncbi:hypothetical protein-putative transmembrane protein [Rhodopirellula baltica SH 1]|uniref:Uncharacterized protein n=4 Tax=Rhodopirellula baltica TaxID=265606 RepID=Q7UUW4_RHOBA|nr:hypothetical protein-putative transmembrane protein [Rhodopirellula baltica SH 1]
MNRGRRTASSGTRSSSLMEILLNILAMTAAIASIIGWLWIAVMAFSEGEVLWGIGCLIISPLCLVYGIMNFQELKIPVLMLGIGLLARIGVAAAAFAVA